ALDLPELPRRIVIVGGGYIAVEFASIFNAAGVSVTMVVRGEAILRGFDQDVRSALMDELRKKGIAIRTEAMVRSIEKEADGTYSVRLAGEELLETDLVMYATGRAPNTRGMGLAEIGVTLTPRGAIAVNAWSESSVPGVYAVGDVTDRINLTPV